MFEFLKRRDEIIAPVTGISMPIDQCSDSVFAEKALGNGLVFIPEKKEIYAPIDGIIVQVSDTLEAVCIEGRGGIEILMHFGIGTSKLDGKGFKFFVNLGTVVEKGDKIAEMDIDYIKEQGYSTEVSFVLLNEDSFKVAEYKYGNMIGGESTAISYKL